MVTSRLLTNVELWNSAGVQQNKSAWWSVTRLRRSYALRQATWIVLPLIPAFYQFVLEFGLEL